MPESETLVVFRILGVLAKARQLGHALRVTEIADAAHLGRPHAERYMNMLEHARAVRTQVASTHPPEYSLTRYGLERLVGGCAMSGGR
jgi:DNA-binding IclR family transcriptional regulator